MLEKWKTLSSSQEDFSLALVQQSQVCTRAIWSGSTSLVMTWIIGFDRTLNKVDITRKVEQGYIQHLFSSSFCEILLQWERGTSANKCIFYRAPNKFDVTRKYAIIYMVTDSSSCFFTWIFCAVSPTLQHLKRRRRNQRKLWQLRILHWTSFWGAAHAVQGPKSPTSARVAAITT